MCLQKEYNHRKTSHRQKDVLEFDPDMILIMSGWNDIGKLGDKKIKSIKDYCILFHHALCNCANRILAIAIEKIGLKK